MAEKTNKRKLATSAIALTTAAALLLGGTLAWQSISQEATNIVSATVNPGGRLHDDFDGSNDKNVYVENFGTQNIYARIKLSEYLEIGQNAGDFTDGAERSDVEVLLGENVDDKSTYTTYLYDKDDAAVDYENISDQYWDKVWDGKTKYIPTFNKDQDSLEADLNGTYEYVNDAGENVPYGDFVDWNNQAEGYSETDTEWYDADTDDNSDVHVNPDSVDAGNHEIKENQTHALADSIEGTVISMADWDGTAGDYWVYDADGWAYWANPIAPGTATGLLLDSITDLGYIDEDYYYAIHVTGQFITAGDLGDTDSTGFYQNAGEEPSAEALELLKTIGVKVDGEEEMLTLLARYTTSSDGDISFLDRVTADINDQIQIVPDVDFEVSDIVFETLGSITTMTDLTAEQYTYDEETDIVTITDPALAGEELLMGVKATNAEDGSEQSIGGIIQLNPIEGGETTTPTITYDSMDMPYAIPSGAAVNLGVENYEGDATAITYYIIDHANNSELVADDNGFFTTPLEDKDGVTVLNLEGSYMGQPITQYFYGKEISSSEIASFSTADTSKLETVTFVAATESDAGGIEVISEVTTKIYNSETHTYLGDASLSIENGSEWYLAFEALDESGNKTGGYCAALGTMSSTELYELYPIETATWNEDSQWYDITGISDTACDGTHSAAAEGLTISIVETDYDGTLAKGQSITLKVDGEYSADDIEWTEENQGVSFSYSTTENEDGTLTITHNSSGLCGGNGQTFIATLKSDSTVTGSIFIDCED